MKSPFLNRITLDQTFVRTDSYFKYTIKWHKISSPVSSKFTPSVVFVHGTPWSSSVWSDFAQALSSAYDVYIFDHAGFGQSPPRESLHEDAASADDLHDISAHLDASHIGQAATFAALLQSWGFPSLKEQDSKDIKTPPHIVAHENGCLTALRAHIIHGYRYASLALVDGVVLGPFETDFLRTVSSQRETFLDLPPNVCNGVVRSYVRHAVFYPLDTETEQVLTQQWFHGGLQGSKQFWKHILQSGRRDVSEIEGRYPAVGGRMPVCVIWGKNDSWIPVDRVSRIAEAVGAKQVIIIENAGHLVMVDQPVRFGIELTIWLDRNNH